jgi:predicted alpha/beta hydrolase family esterase
LARAWGSDFLNLGLKGHVNAESNLGDWPEGRAMLNSLMKEKEDGH